MPRPLTPAIAQQQQSALPPGFFAQLGDPNSPINAGALGLGGALLEYGRPQIREGDANIAGALSAGTNGLLGGLAAQKAQAREDKLNAMLEDVAQRQMGMLAPPPQQQAQMQQPIQTQQSRPPGMQGGPLAPTAGGGFGAMAPFSSPAKVPPNPLDRTTRLMMASGGGPLAPGMPGIY